MTAPARTAAYHALRAIAGRRAPTSLPPSRQAGSTSPTSGIAPSPPRSSRARSGGSGASTTWSSTSRIARFPRLDPEVTRHPASQPVPVAAPRAAFRLPRSWTTRWISRARRASRARAASSTPYSATLPRSGIGCRCPPRPEDAGDRAAALDYLGITHSHPEWLVARWLDRYGFDAAERWVQFNNDTPSLTLRANRLRVLREEVARALAERRHRDGADSACAARPDRHGREPAAAAAGRPVLRAGRSVTTRPAGRGRAAGRSRAGPLRVPRRQDDRDGG